MKIVNILNSENIQCMGTHARALSAFGHLVLICSNLTSANPVISPIFLYGLLFCLFFVIRLFLPVVFEV